MVVQPTLEMSSYPALTALNARGSKRLSLVR